MNIAEFATLLCLETDRHVFCTVRFHQRRTMLGYQERYGMSFVFSYQRKASGLIMLPPCKLMPIIGDRLPRDTGRETERETESIKL